MTKKSDAVTVSDAKAAAGSTPPGSQYINQKINISEYMDYAQALSYNDSGLQSQIDMEPLTVNGQAVEIYDAQNGVQAEAFISTGTGPQHIIIGYAGVGVDKQIGAAETSSLYSNPNSATGSSGDLFTGAEVQDGIAVLAGQVPTGAEGSATSFAKQVINDATALGLTKNDVSLTGHNLGGTLAEYAASNTGLSGTTFGAAGIVNGHSKGVENFTNIVETGDVLGNYATDNGNPLGPIVQSPNIKHYGNVRLVGDGDDQTTMRAEAANAYASHDYKVAGALLDNGLMKDSLGAHYAVDLKGVSTFQDFGSFAAPNGAGPSSSATSTQATTPAAVAPPSTTVPLPSAQVVNQDINICNYMYSSKTELFSDSRLASLGLKPLINNGKVVQVYNQKAGVAAEAFETTGTGASQIIIAYEGTSPYGLGDTGEFTGGQLLDDASFFAGKPAPCATAAGNFAKKVLGIAQTMNIGTDQVSLTGHSLGAAEAEYAAEATGLKGVTFGTPGIDITGNLPPSQLTNFVDEGDPVGNLGTDGADPLGNFVTSPDIAHYGGVTLIGATDANASAAQKNLSTTATNFFDPTSPDYKDLGTATTNLGSDFQYHHLTSYAKLLNETYPDYDNSISLVCYCTGTAIRTERGDRAVETLRPGDLVSTVTGATRVIKWIGHRTIQCRRYSRPLEVMPVRIAAHAFGEDLPARDLYLSPGHPVLVGADDDGEGGHLVPIMCLINGTTIDRAKVDEVTYWHVELDEHDILLAEGLPAESYIDLGSRSWFAGAEGALYDPDMALPEMPGRCRPVAVVGPIVDAARRDLDVAFAMRLATACAWPSADDARFAD